MTVLPSSTSEVVGRTGDVQRMLLRRYLDRVRGLRATDGRPSAWRPDPRTLDEPAAPPATIRLATEFIDTHASELITLAEIAAAARLSPRALQATFRRHLDTTPLAYLRSTRMARVHAALQTARPGDGQTVSTIASAWGFGQLSRFARDYRRRYGHSPRETLLRPRR